MSPRSRLRDYNAYFGRKGKVNIFKIKSQLLEFGKETFKKEKSERNNYFLEKIGIFFKKSSAKKILLLGRAGTGKTSIKKIIFEVNNLQLETGRNKLINYGKKGYFCRSKWSR